MFGFGLWLLYSYDDVYARNLFKVNGAAYSKTPSSCIKNIASLGGDWHVVKALEMPSKPVPFLKATIAYIILKSDIQKQYIISFRGTVGRDQLVIQFLQSGKTKFESYGKVNNYFQSSFNLLWPSIKAQISNAKKDGYSIVVTGFSLGGALATITGLKVVAEGYQTKENVYLLTYGAPRVGSAIFSQHVDNLLKYSHRVVNQADPVPHIPPCVSFRQNTCSTLFDGYYHSQTEVWYNSGSSSANSKYVVTTVNEDSKIGSNSLKTDRVLANHLGYFGINPESFAGLNCVG